MKHAGWWGLSIIACAPVVIAGQVMLGLSVWEMAPVWVAVVLYRDVMSFRDRRYGGAA